MTSKPTNGTAKAILWAAGSALGIVVVLTGITASHVNKTVEPVRADVARHEIALEHQHDKVSETMQRLSSIEAKIDILLAERTP